MMRVHSGLVSPGMRVSSARQWAGRIAVFFCILLFGLPAQAAGNGDADVTAGIQAFDAGADQNAWNYFSLAEKEGSTEALYWLGHMTELGLATKQDLPKAADYYRRAATAGWVMAQAKLGHFYLEGEGVMQDFAKARTLLEEAAYKNFADAQYDLGHIYADGLGTTKSPVSAYVWYDFAARGGNPQYRKARDNALKGLSPDEVVQAQKFAETLRGSIFGAAPSGN